MYFQTKFSYIQLDFVAIACPNEQIAQYYMDLVVELPQQGLAEFLSFYHSSALYSYLVDSFGTAKHFEEPTDENGEGAEVGKLIYTWKFFLIMKNMIHFKSTLNTLNNSSIKFIHISYFSVINTFEREYFIRLSIFCLKQFFGFSRKFLEFGFFYFLLKKFKKFWKILKYTKSFIYFY